jgi:hypothetical protein
MSERPKRQSKVPSRFNDSILYDNLDINERFELVNKTIPVKKELPPDVKIPNLKKYYRPYYSPKFDSWEMDFLISNLPLDTFVLQDLMETNSKLNWLFIININTKYLYVFPCFDKKSSSVIECLDVMLNNLVKIDNIRGDYEGAFTSKITTKWLNDHNIKYYFTPYSKTNRNRIVDRVIRTIRKKADNYFLQNHVNPFLHKDLIDTLVKEYNEENYHNGLGRNQGFELMFTPKEVQENKEIENLFIWNNHIRLKKLQPDIEHFKKYKPGNILIVHIPRDNFYHTKEERNFNNYAKFIKYFHGNVYCEILTGMHKNERMCLPMFFTILIGEDENNIDAKYKTNFNQEYGN